MKFISAICVSAAIVLPTSAAYAQKAPPAAPTQKAELERIAAGIRSSCKGSLSSPIKFVGAVARPGGSYVIYTDLPDQGCPLKGEVKYICDKAIEQGWFCQPDKIENTLYVR